MKTRKRYPYRPSQVPVTQGMLYGVRDELKAEVRSVEAKMSSQIHRLAVLMEEQNSKNNVVLDGLGNLFHRQRIEDEMIAHNKLLAALK